MSSNQYNKVFNSNIYFDGRNFLGKAEEITLPEIQGKMVDHKGLGIIGEIEMAAGLQKMSAKIKWNGIYPEVLKKTLNMHKSTQLQVRGNVEVYSAGDRVAQKPMVAFLTVTSKKNDGLVFKQMDNVESGSEFNVTAYKLEFDGEEIYDIDIPNNIWRVLGVDQLAEMRANIGA